MVTPRYGLTESRRGRAPDKRLAPRACSPPGSSAVGLEPVASRPVIKTTRSRNGSSGFVIKENSKLEPSCSGLQYPGAAPCGCQMPTKRLTEPGPAAVWRRGVWAGSIDSRKGKAKVTPQPRRNVLLGMCFLAINIYLSSAIFSPQKGTKMTHFALCLLCNKAATFSFLDKVFGAAHSPPRRGGVSATSKTMDPFRFVVDGVVSSARLRRPAELTTNSA